MTSAVEDWFVLEVSGRSFNQHSWAAPPEREKEIDKTPLLSRKNSGGGQIIGVRDLSARRSAYDAAQDSDDCITDDARYTLIDNKKCYKCHRFGWVEWLFIVVATLTMINILGMSIERFVHIHNTFGNLTPDSSGNGSAGSGGDSQLYCNHWSCLNDFTFALVVMVNLFFSMYYFFDGLLRLQPFEMIGYAITMFIVSMYVIANYFIEGEQEDVVKLVRFVLVVLLGPLNISLALVIQYRMGYLTLNTIRNDRLLTKAYHSRSLFLTIQTCNIQILINVLVLSWVKAGHFSGLGEKIILPLLIVYTIFISLLGWTSVIWEIKILSIIWSFLATLSFGYYPYKIVHVGVHWSYYKEVFTDYYTNGQSPSQTHFLYIAIVMLFTCALGLLTVLVMLILMVVVLLNFGKGLKERIPPPCCTGEQSEYDMLTEND